MVRPWSRRCTNVRENPEMDMGVMHAERGVGVYRGVSFRHEISIGLWTRWLFPPVAPAVYDNAKGRRRIEVNTRSTRTRRRIDGHT